MIMKTTTEHQEKLQKEVDFFFNTYNSSKPFLDTLNELLIHFVENTTENEELYSKEYKVQIVDNYKFIKQFIQTLAPLVSANYINDKKEVLIHRIQRNKITIDELV